MPYFAAAAVTLSLIGAGVSAFTSVQQGKAQEKAAEFNARKAEAEAENLRLETVENIRRQRKENRRYLARQRALFAGRGIAMEGTALEILASSASTLELGIQDLFRGSGIKQGGLISGAAMDRSEGADARRAGNLAAGASLLQGAGSVFNTLADAD